MISSVDKTNTMVIMKTEDYKLNIKELLNSNPTSNFKMRC